MECSPNEDCKYYPACYTDVHHKMWPRSRYKNGVERKFRELPQNKVEMCRNEHNELHATTRPPKRPSRQIMLAALGGNMELEKTPTAMQEFNKRMEVVTSEAIQKKLAEVATTGFVDAQWDDMGTYLTGKE